MALFFQKGRGIMALIFQKGRGIMVSFFQKGRGKSVFCLLSVCLSRWKIEDFQDKIEDFP